MSSTSSKTRLGIAGALVLLGLILLIVGLLSGGSVKLQGFNNGQQINAKDAGFSVFSPDQSARSAVTCQADQGGQKSTLDRPSNDFSISADGTKYWEIARSTDGMKSGTYTVTCSGKDGVQTFAGAKEGKAGGGALRLLGLILGPILLLAGLALAAISLMRKKSATGDQQNAYNQQGAYGQQGGYNQGQSG
ncbi:hypothetical protein, partial [Luteipulveratus flavus]